MHPQLEVIFAREQLRLTQPRQLVFDVMHASDMPLSIKDIAKQASGVDRVSVYRTIELFIKLGIVEAVPLGWKQRYELTDPFKAHHHHLYCTKCGKLIDIHSKKLELIVAHIAKEHGFTPSEHKFEVSGLCEKCQAASR